MSGLPYISHLSAQTWLGIAAAVVLVILLVAVRASRARNIVMSSTTAEMIAYHLSRIADALDRGELLRRTSAEPRRAAAATAEPVRTVETRPVEAPAAVGEGRPAQRVNMSMFGR